MFIEQSPQDGIPGLKNLATVKLNPTHRQMLEQAMQTCGGPPPLQNRKQAEARELTALAQLAPPGRLSIEALEMREHLRAVLTLQVPVPCAPRDDQELVVFDHAVVGFTYPREGFHRPLPGYAFFQILLPRNIWLPQVKQPEQAFCIAPVVPAGTRAALLLLRLYGALSMQSIQIDTGDPAGVFNPAIALWWQDNLHRTPLTRTAFLDSDPSPPDQPQIRIAE